MHSLVKPKAWVVIRLSSENVKLEQMLPNTTVSLGKFGTFKTNDIIGRPYYLTYEIKDQKNGQSSGLRVVPASERYADIFAEEEAAEKGSEDENIILGGDGVTFELVGEDGEVVMRSNRETIDDSARQTLTMEEIEALKRDGADAGKDIIAKLLLSHTGLDKKTSFSLAKYKILKTKKFLRHFTILPLDVPMLTQILAGTDNSTKTLEIRDETLGLLGCWANVHLTCHLPQLSTINGSQDQPSGRWLVLDDAGGLLVAAMAERMGILYPEDDEDELQNDLDESAEQQVNGGQIRRQKPPNDDVPFYSSTNTLTLIHTNQQPNIHLLKYFDFNLDPPPPDHPLSRHLKPISWLQLLSPQEDSTYANDPPSELPEVLESWKSSRRGNYYRKRRRWARTHQIVNETQAGGFDGLVVMTTLDLIGVMRSCVPLLRGGAQVAVYSPTIEPLSELLDLYSRERRTAFVRHPPEGDDLVNWNGNEDFPLNPTLLLGVDIQTSRARPWQVLPGRTHPLMTSKGGAEGYVFTATRVLPAEGKISARGAYTKKRKLDNDGSGSATPGYSEAAVDTPMSTEKE